MILLPDDIFCAKKALGKFLALVFFATFSSQALAIDNSAADRARVVAARNDRFYKTNLIRNYINIGGEYESDENSKQHLLQLGHFYRSKKWINEIGFIYDNKYAEKKSVNNGALSKTAELYDFQLSSKFMIGDTPDYLVLYNRSKYDELSKYYYDLTSAIGVGRIFFDGRLEIDVGLGQSRVKEYDDKITYIPSFRCEFPLSDRLRFIQRGFMFFSDVADDYQLNTRLQYSITRKLYLQITHDFDKRNYVNQTKNTKVNEVHRRMVFGFRYDLM